MACPTPQRQIEIDSEPGRGTRIGISLPVGKVGEVSSGDPVASAPDTAESMYLLVIDDDPLVLQAVRDILELEGHRVTIREGGEEGIAAFNSAEDSKAPWPEPSPFARFSVYAFVGLIEVILLFTLSIKVEERLRSRDYAPEWRR